jgi:two-component system, NarL family, nitrate/nitrite response regulator NarL
LDGIVSRGIDTADMSVETLQKEITVVVVDDHPVYRDGLERGLATSDRIAVVAGAGDGPSGLDAIRTERPDVAIVDQRLPGSPGVEVVRAVVAAGIPTRILVISASAHLSVAFEALQAGAAGFLGKEATRSEIVDAVLRIAAGETVVPPALAAGLGDQIRRRRPIPVPLSPREKRVLEGFAAGRSIPAIAADLDLAPSTVKTHTEHLYAKLAVADRAAAVAEGMRRGLLD